MLGYDESRLTGENGIKVYARYGIDLLSIADLRFPLPGPDERRFLNRTPSGR